MEAKTIAGSIQTALTAIEKLETDLIKAQATADKMSAEEDRNIFRIDLLEELRYRMRGMNRRAEALTDYINNIIWKIGP